MAYALSLSGLLTTFRHHFVQRPHAQCKFNGVPSLLMHQMALVRNSDIHHGQLLVYVCVVTVILQIGLHDLKDNLLPTCLGIMNIIL